MYIIYYKENTATSKESQKHVTCDYLKDVEETIDRLVKQGHEVTHAFNAENDLFAYIKKGQADFANKCYMYGLSPDIYGEKVLLSNGEICKIKNIKPRNRKYPIIVWSEQSNKSYKLSPRQTMFAKERYDEMQKGDAAT